ncbi:MAG TPA: hypothetical protein VGL77_04925 [Armatimonadota bacterium]|jgi:hypothetical protein
MIPEIRVSLVIQDESITSDMLDKFTSLGATRCWTKGQLKPLLSYSNNGCRFRSELISSCNADEVAVTFIKKLIEDSPEIFDIMHEYDISPMLTIAAYVADSMPSFYFESSAIKLLAQFNISINFDIMRITDD